MSSHSKGPWVTVLNGGIGQLIESADGDVIVYAIGNAGMRVLEKAANARRIVACVNICAGISIEELERHHDLVSAQLASELSQRDELLSALEQLFEIGEVYASAIERDEHNAAGNKKDFREWEVIARAAIAKARGEA